VLKNEVEVANPFIESGSKYRDLLVAAMSSGDWAQIVQAARVGNSLQKYFAVKSQYLVNPQGLEDASRQLFPNAQAKDLGNYGHFLQWEAPDEVNRELMTFLA